MPKDRRLTSALEELEEEQTTATRKTGSCPHCEAVVFISKSGTPLKHEGPCGLPCLGGGVGVGVAFHSRDCDQTGCKPLEIPLPGVPKMSGKRGR